ncbi:MAG: fibronectin type III domain-containing protein [Acidimicrobiales bacterium]
MRLAITFAIFAILTTVATIFGASWVGAEDICAPDAPRCPAPPPQQLELNALTPESVHVDWQSANGEQTSVNGFRVTVGEVSHDGVGQPVVECPELARSIGFASPDGETPEPADSQCILEGLTPGKRYEIAVEETNARIGSFLAKSRITMPVHAPLQVEATPSSGEPGIETTVAWSDPDDMTGIAGYYVTLRELSGSAVELCNPPLDVDRRCGFGDLIEGDYVVRVRSVSGSVILPASTSTIIEIEFHIGETIDSPADVKLPVVDPCADEGEHGTRLIRSIDRIRARYDAAVQASIEKFVRRPKKLATALAQLQDRRTRRTARVKVLFQANCPTS